MPETSLTHLSKHVYWMSPGKPDRPSLCAVVGTRRTLLIDAGASAAHASLFLDTLRKSGVPSPDFVVLTHWHWDHVFGAAVMNIPIIAHRQTARQLAVLSGYAWNDAALDERVRTGDEIASCAADIKQELPEPRSVQIMLPDLILEDSLEIDLGDVTCHIRHVGGDHSSDSCVVHIREDRLLVLGDCLYDAIYAPVRHYTKSNLFPLIDTVLDFQADQFIEGHTDELLSRNELEILTGKMRLALSLVERFGTEEAAILAQLDQRDEDTEYFIRGLIAGIRLHPAAPDVSRHADSIPESLN
jgi:glyoxylase-like metal-dependent hydrolase (beta-lactamase superfamily II)